ncbi:MAG: efflux RND transporter permease subunit, partial [Pseudomonadota bacterium]
MNIATLSIARPIYTWIVMLICIFGGYWGFNNLGRLEDPAFTIKTAVVTTFYPGADAMQVAREISEPLESAIQKMGEVDEIRSVNQPGFSQISVDVKDTYGGDELPDIWTKMRDRVNDVRLPSGANPPIINDTFGDVFGIYYAVTAPGYTNSEVYELSTFLRRELLTVSGVADVNISGLRDEVIYVEPDPVVSTNLNISPAAVTQAIADADSVAEGGTLYSPDGRVRIQRPEGSDSVSAIAGLTVGVGGEVLNLFDFAAVSRGEEANPNLMLRHNGEDAFTLGVAGISSENIVDVGHRVDDKLAEMAHLLPAGVEITP